VPAETYFTIADERFFQGAVALLNSLRLTGNRGTFVVLDRGLNAEQRRLLDGHATVVDLRDVDLHPFMLKSYIHELQPEGIFFWIDSDMIVTRSLADLAAGAADGHFYLFRDYNSDRFEPEWQQLFALRSPLRRATYLNAGFIAFSHGHGKQLLARWAELCKTIPPDVALQGRVGHPLWNSDQDALNALLMSEVPRDLVVELPLEEMPLTGVMHQVEVVDAASLTCSLNGSRPRILHYVGAIKPWMPDAWRKVNRDAYTRLLIRSLCASGVEVRLAAEQVPLWLRPGRLGRLSLGALSCVHGPRARLVDLGRGVVHRMPRGLREPILKARGRRLHSRGR
jgi:hypothetical protein